MAQTIKKKSKKEQPSRMLSAEFGVYPVVVLVGRVNVGKSTLFNTLLEQRKAVTSAVPGTTRDVNYGLCTWRGATFILVDTGGFSGGVQTEMEKKTGEHARRIIRAADCILFMTDRREGFNPDDRRIVQDVHKLTRAPVILAVNKAERATATEADEWSEWHKLGLGDPLYLSAINGRGTGDLLDRVVEALPKKNTGSASADDVPETRIAIVGRPNVGKSSVLNRILGEERVIVSPRPHTTREPQDTLLEYDDGLSLRIIDTVGMRKKSRVASRIDKEGLARSITAIEKADIVILVLESTVTPSKQESRLVSIAKERGAGLMIAVNKWDLIIEKTTKTSKTFEDFFMHYFKGALWAPVIFISALTGQRVAKLLGIVRLCMENRARRITQEELDVFLARALAHQKPVWQRGKKKPVVHGLHQTGINPPTFALTVNERTSMSYAYLRYLENRLREVYDFIGTPVRIHTEVQKRVTHNP